MGAISFICHVCHRTFGVDACLLPLIPAVIQCPQCHTRYVWTRLKGSKRVGWHQPHSSVELVTFPHFVEGQSLVERPRHSVHGSDHD